MSGTRKLKVKLFADGADLAGMKEMAANPMIKGFTTNPTLMRKAGISDYKAFAGDVLKAIPDRPVSFEVFADDFGEMEAQARREPRSVRPPQPHNPRSRAPARAPRRRERKSSPPRR